MCDRREVRAGAHLSRRKNGSGRERISNDDLTLKDLKAFDHGALG